MIRSGCLQHAQNGCYCKRRDAEQASGTQHARALAAALGEKATLTGLRLGFNESVGVAGAEASAAVAALDKKNATLKSLDLDENGVGAQGALALRGGTRQKRDTRGATPHG